MKVNCVLLFKQTNFLSKVILSSLDLIETRTEVVGILLYIREDIPYKELKLHRHPSDNEGIFVEVNLRKTKWLLFATYSTPSQVDELFFFFFGEVGKSLDKYSQIYSKFLLTGDFNAEASEPVLARIFKLARTSMNNPSCINLIIPNSPNSFQSTSTLCTGLSDFH